MEHVLIIVIPSHAQINVTKRTYLLVVEEADGFGFDFVRTKAKQILTQ